MDLKTLQAEFDALETGSSFTERLAFIKKLLAETTPEAVQFHLQLLNRRENQQFYYEVRACFDKRGMDAEPALLDILDGKSTVTGKADALQLLGHLRSPSAPEYARGYLGSPDRELRYKAIIVLGWTGKGIDDVKRLEHAIKTDPDPQLRGFAASAIRQMWFNDASLVAEMVRAIGSNLKNETEKEALEGILISLQTLTKKSFGIRERISEATVTGDMEKGKKRALEYLASLPK